MRIDLVFPVLPPTLDGVGDYTAHLAREMASACDIRILTAQAEATPIPGVRIEPAFSLEWPWQIGGLVDAVAADPPDWLLIQFVPFSYGRWGLNPYLPLALRRIKNALPDTQIALMAHEDFPSFTEGTKLAIMSLWQRPLFWALGQLADHVFLSIDVWAQRYQTWFPDTPVEHLPVGSNIPRLGITRPEARERFQLPSEAFVVGAFGNAHPSRQLDRIGTALTHLQSLLPNVCALYAGAEGTAFRRRIPDTVPFYDLGPLPAEAVSAAFETMDLYLTPFRNGVSTRRGSFLVGIQHEVPTLSTHGNETDPLLIDRNEEAFLLVPWEDPALFCTAAERLALSSTERTRIGTRGATFFEATFAWPRIADRLLSALHRSRAAKETAPSAF